MTESNGSQGSDQGAEGTPSAGDPPAGSEGTPPQDPPPPNPAAREEPEERRFLGIKLHNLIFIGLALGVVLGWITYELEHFDRVLVADAVDPATLDVSQEVLDELPREQGRIVLEGDVVKKEDVVLVQRPDGSEVRLDPSQVGEVVQAERGLYDGLVWWFNLFGKVIFIGALKMLIAPLIFASIVAGIASLTGLDQLKRIGLKTAAYYACTTLIAVAIGLVAVLTIRPGYKDASQRIHDLRQAKVERYAAAWEEETGQEARIDAEEPNPDFVAHLAEESAREAGTGHEAERFARVSAAREVDGATILRDQLISPMLTNPFESLTTTNSLGIIFFAVLFGVFTVITGEMGRPVAEFFISLNEVIVAITKWLMAFAPFFVMCLVAELIAKSGPNVFGSLAWYCVTVIAGIAVHVGVLVGIAYLVAGVTPRRLWQGISDAWLIAFSTRSSAATLPVTLRCVVEKLGVSPRVANFALPVGATMNMDGTALYEGVAVIFLIQIFAGVPDVDPSMLAGAAVLVIFLTAVMASIGAAAVPDAGLVTMVLVATAVGLPVYYIPLIFAVDAFLDMFRTSTNVLGDSVGCLVVQRLEDRAAA